jgi:selenocysteine lyase/cysteine desulfurase
MLAGQLRQQLAGIAGVTVRDLPGSSGHSGSGIVTFTHDRHAAQSIFERMRDQRINVRVTAVFSTRIDMEDRGLPDMVRASVHYYNTGEELARFTQAIRGL